MVNSPGRHNISGLSPKGKSMAHKVKEMEQIKSLQITMVRNYTLEKDVNSVCQKRGTKKKPESRRKST